MEELNGLSSEFIEKAKETGEFISSGEALKDVVSVEVLSGRRKVEIINTNDETQITNEELLQLHEEYENLATSLSKTTSEILSENEVEEFPEITPEEMALKFNQRAEFSHL